MNFKTIFNNLNSLRKKIKIDDVIIISDEAVDSFFRNGVIAYKIKVYEDKKIDDYYLLYEDEFGLSPKLAYLNLQKVEDEKAKKILNAYEKTFNEYFNKLIKKYK